MRVLFVAALAAAGVFASPVYATGHNTFFNKDTCAFYARSIKVHDEIVQSAQKQRDAFISSVDIKKAEAVGRAQAPHIDQLAKLAAIYNAFYKP